ncbi:hypothetical protein ACTHQY_15045 [Rhodococcoides corynebacterioides]|uniref:hypothetical protein n=1 Tax=Rhodococcoides corynebacterioides TaxID=53972 RepID=UPI003F7EFD78
MRLLRRVPAAVGAWLDAAPKQASLELRGFVLVLGVATMLALLLWPPVVAWLGVPASAYLIPLYCSAIASYLMGTLLRLVFR